MAKNDFYVLIVNDLRGVKPHKKLSFFYKGFHLVFLLDFQIVI